MTERQQTDAEPEARSPGISRGQDEPDDAEQAGPSGTRSGPNSEYAANAEADGPGPGDVEGGDGNPTAADLDPHEPPGQG